MSVKKDYEIKTHTVTEKVLVKETRYCDICKKEIENNKSYWRLTTHHNDWGNDSIDSYEYFIKYVILNYDENDTEGFETLRRMMRAYNSYNNRK